jgi:hypothetical protein
MTSTSEIMNDMEQTRAEIRATLGAIERRMTFENVVERYVVPTRAQAADYGRAFGDAVRANPLALGVTAIGIGWLMLGPRRPAPAIAASAEPAAGGRARERRLDPSRVGDVDTAEVRQGASPTAAEPEPEAASGGSAQAAQQAAGRAGHTGERAREMAGAAAARARDVAGRGRSWAAGTSARVGRTAGSAYHATRETVSRVGGRVRHGAGTAGGYAREHPLATGAVLMVGGAALALLLARRSPRHHDLEAEEELAVMPETPYASGAQADFKSPHRNPTVPLTPEDEEPVYASGDLSSEAKPRRGGNGGYEPGSHGSRSSGTEFVGTGGGAAGLTPAGVPKQGASVYPAEATTATPDTAIPDTPQVAEPTTTPRTPADEEREPAAVSGGESPARRGARQTGRA